MSSSKPGIPTDEFPAPGGDYIEERNLLGSAFVFRTYAYRENLFAEFEGLVEEGRLFDGLIIDLMQTGYSLPLEAFVKFGAYARRLLKSQGVMLFVKSDGAITLCRDEPSGGLTFTAYDSPFGIFARYPMLADYVCATVSGIDRRRLRGGGSTLANHILYTSTPVLTEKGRELKDAFEIPPPQNWLIQLIDDYTSVESMSRCLEKEYNVPADETLRLLQELESERVIYPIFTRLHFLSNCYHNRKPFRLGRYMVAAGLVTASELQELLEIQQEEGWGRNQKTFLGLIAVRKGYLNTRELEVLLNDQYLYGGYHKVADGDDGTTPKTVNIETMRDSMIGSLGAIDAAGVLQSLSTAKKTGLLTVENRDQRMAVAFVEGRPTHARMGKLVGYDAVVEFIIGWREGIFVFRDKGESLDLDDDCLVDRPLERLLLDAALFQDQICKILACLPSGRNTVLERVWNFDDLWRRSRPASLSFSDGTPVAHEELARIEELASHFDGLTTLDEVVKACETWPTHAVLRSVQLLAENQLLTVQKTSLFRPLTVFQSVAAEMERHLGKDTNRALLDASLHYVHGNSPAAGRFNVDHEGRVSVDLSHVKQTSTPVSAVLLEMRRWLEAYLAYCRREMDPHVVNNAVAKVVHGSLG